MRDIHDVVEITVYDEDKDHKFECLGRIVIPLLRVKNGERRWYKLKDKTLMKDEDNQDPEEQSQNLVIEVEGPTPSGTAVDV